MCYRCFWPQPLCWCASITPMETRTRFIFLMHPKEFKKEKAATGRLTHLCLARSEIHMGVEFDAHVEVQALIRDPGNFRRIPIRNRAIMQHKKKHRRRLPRIRQRPLHRPIHILQRKLLRLRGKREDGG